MRFIVTIALPTVATLAVAAPSSFARNPVPASLTKRDVACAINQPRLTEARVADIVNELTGENKDFTVKSGTQNFLISCKGGTGVFLNVDPHDPAIDQTFESFNIGSEVKSGFSDCYFHDPNSGAGDKSFQAAYQFFGSGYNYVIHGSAC
jgi:hypothetical protein